MHEQTKHKRKEQPRTKQALENQCKALDICRAYQVLIQGYVRSLQTTQQNQSLPLRKETR